MFQAKIMSKKRAIRQDRPKSVTESQLVLCFDSSSVRHFPLVHSQAEAAIRIGADPRLEENRSALLSVIRQGNKCASVTFLALRPLHHPRLLAADPNRIVRAEIIRPFNLKQRRRSRAEVKRARAVQALYQAGSVILLERADREAAIVAAQQRSLAVEHGLEHDFAAP